MGSTRRALDPSFLWRGPPDKQVLQVGGQCAGAIPAQGLIQAVQALDQIGDLFPGVTPSCLLAEMGSAAEGAMAVNAAAPQRIKQGAGPVLPLWQAAATAGSDCSGGIKGFAKGQHGHTTSQPKLAALGEGSALIELGALL